jgi:hypothetical protein
MVAGGSKRLSNRCWANLTYLRDMTLLSQYYYRKNTNTFEGFFVLLSLRGRCDEN